MKHIKYSWDEFEADCKKLALKINIEEFDCIVGITRGGMVIATLLAELLAKKELYSIGYNRYKGDERGDELVRIGTVHQDLKDKRILLVDDISDTGDTLATAVHDLINKGNKLVTATIHYSKETSLMPDLTIKETKDWIDYPWDYHN